MPEKKAKKKAPKKIVIRGKRPRDPNQLAKWIVDGSTIEPPEEFIVPAWAMFTGFPPSCAGTPFDRT